MTRVPKEDGTFLILATSSSIPSIIKEINTFHSHQIINIDLTELLLTLCLTSTLARRVKMALVAMYNLALSSLTSLVGWFATEFTFSSHLQQRELY